MKKLISYLTIINLLLITFSCGGGGSSKGVSPVTVLASFKTSSAGSAAMKAQVTTLTNIRYTVSGSDMETMTGTVPVTSNLVEFTLEVPNGPQRHFLVEALDDLNNVRYKGESCVDLNGLPITVTITLTETSISIIGDFPLFTPEPNDTQALAIVQTIPPHNSMGIDPNITISIFFNDEIDPLTINDHSIQVKDSNGNQKFGIYSGSLSAAGNTILNFKPFAALPEGEIMTVTLFQSSGVKDDGGNTLSSDLVFSFQTKQQSVPPADLGFEQGATGWNFSGDGAILSSPKDDISSVEGQYMAAISTGDIFGGQALEDTTSILTSGPIPVPPEKKYISFNYDFISEEFDEWVGKGYDDVFKVSVSGSSGSYSEPVASVNTIGVDNSFPVNFGGLSGADHTGWLTKTIDISSLGSPIIISFEISDVGDNVVTSAVVIDNINFQ
jgi:hypothetical protein